MTDTEREPERPAVWRVPIVLGLASLAGLISALVGDGLWDAASWLGLGAPLLLAGWHIGRQRSET